MPDPLIRGAVVLSRRGFSVVWDVCGDQLVLLPIIRPRRDLAIDVRLDQADLDAGGITLSGAVVRPKANPPIAKQGHQVVGALVGPVLCRVVLGVIRASKDARDHAKWAHELRQKDRVAEERCVNLLT